MLNDRVGHLNGYPFRRLAALLSDVTPAEGIAPLSMAVGEPQLPTPAILVEALRASEHLWNKYPPAAGTPEWRQAVAGWLTRRYKLAASVIDPDRNVVPAPGTREALFQLALAVTPRAKAGLTPAVCMPNPFYQVYAGAAAYAGAEAVLLPAARERNFMPDLDRLTPELLDRTALIYLCTPANPQGTCADLPYLMRLIELARSHDVIVAVDECYAEIYDTVAPTGALKAAQTLGGGFDNVVVFHSLSKRSSAPGLRSGFVAGDERVIKALLSLMEYGGAGMSLPVQAAAAALWSDEAHVEAVRATYRRNFEIAGRILGNRFGYYRPAGGFFLWLDVGDGKKAARDLWRKAALRTLPGAYLADIDRDGPNPGAPYLRVALVHPPDITEAGLARLADTL
jgi:N-succinyldiaminopimelate aminotransferase